MVLDGIELGPGSLMSSFQARQSKGTLVVFMDGGLEREERG
jgi:hypothetical protein